MLHLLRSTWRLWVTVWWCWHTEVCSAEAAAKLDAMRRIRDMPESPASPPPPPYSVGPLIPRRPLTPEEIATFHRDGYVTLRNFFSSTEMDMLRGCVVSDPLVMGTPMDGSLGKNISVADANGRKTKLTLWWNFGGDSYGLLGRSASMMQAASTLMGGAEPYSSHTKILLKEPFTGGAWEWHQDFGYWYAQGLNHPDKIVSGIVAIDANDRRNGAMRVLVGSHKLGRLDHGVYGGQAGADPERVLAAMSTMPIRPLLLRPGDVTFTHSNLLHCSAPNNSSRWRRNIIVAYNSRHNQPLENFAAGQPVYTAAEVVPDTALLGSGCRPLSADRSDFLGQQQTKESIEDNPVLRDTNEL